MTVAWLKDETPLSPSAKFEMHSLSDGSETLVVHDAGPKDEGAFCLQGNCPGVYTCKAEGEFGLSDSSCEVRWEITEEHNESAPPPVEADDFAKKVYTDQVVAPAGESEEGKERATVENESEDYSKTTEITKAEGFSLSTCPSFCQKSTSYW